MNAASKPTRNSRRQSDISWITIDLIIPFIIKSLTGLRARFFCNFQVELPRIAVITVTTSHSAPCSNSSMNIRHLKTCIAACALALSLGAVGDEIYKWTDAEGNVHYEDRPSGNASEQTMQVTYNRTNNTVVQSRVQSRRDYEAAREDSRADAKKAELTASEERKAAEQRAVQCTNYRQKMKTMLEAPRVYREGEDGERAYLDDTARADARQQAEELIKEACGS